MKRSSLTEFELEEENFKLRICRKNEESPTVLQAPAASMMAVPPAPATAPSAPVAATAAAPAAVDPEKLIKSPMVGTFYAAPNPESPAFVKVGDKVTEQSVVCILEAMKVMNEILAEKRGTIAEILIENGDSVEYGQPLFRLQ